MLVCQQVSTEKQQFLTCPLPDEQQGLFGMTDVGVDRTAVDTEDTCGLAYGVMTFGDDPMQMFLEKHSPLWLVFTKVGK